MTGDYPLTLPPVNHTAPVPRRIRATLAGQTVLDTMAALYVWESPQYPQYYIPLADVDAAVLVDEQHPQKLSRGTARRYGLQVGELTRPAALRVYGDDAVVAGSPDGRGSSGPRSTPGSRRTSRSSSTRATPTRASTRCARRAASESSSKAWCWPSRARR